MPTCLDSLALLLLAIALDNSWNPDSFQYLSKLTKRGQFLVQVKRDIHNPSLRIFLHPDSGALQGAFGEACI